MSLHVEIRPFHQKVAYEYLWWLAPFRLPRLGNQFRPIRGGCNEHNRLVWIFNTGYTWLPTNNIGPHRVSQPKGLLDVSAGNPVEFCRSLVPWKYWGEDVLESCSYHFRICILTEFKSHSAQSVILNCSNVNKSLLNVQLLFPEFYLKTNLPTSNMDLPCCSSLSLWPETEVLNVLCGNFIPCNFTIWMGPVCQRYQLW